MSFVRCNSDRNVGSGSTRAKHVANAQTFPIQTALLPCSGEQSHVHSRTDTRGETNLLRRDLSRSRATLCTQKIARPNIFQQLDISKSRNVPKPHRPPKYRTPSFWREYLNQVPNAAIIAFAGGYVHTVLVWWQRLQEQESVILFTVFGIVLKLALQEAARHYVLKKRIRSTRTMCLLVGVPTVLIDTQSRIVLLGTQTNSLLVIGTFAMAVSEVGLRAAKAAFVVWTTRRRSRVLDKKLQQISCTTARSGRTSTERVLSSSLKLEFQLWKRQVIAYHTAEVTADMYAEYIAIGCSQSIVFWWFGHPLYPVLQMEKGSALSELDVSRLRYNQVAMLGFQSLVEVFVDYVCIVVEMAAGIEFDRIKDLSTFLGALFVTMAVININISSGVYLG